MVKCKKDAHTRVFVVVVFINAKCRKEARQLQDGRPGACVRVGTSTRSAPML